VIALALLLGCGGAVDCADPAVVVAQVGGQVLTCEQGTAVAAYVEALAGRPLVPGDEGLVVAAVGARFRADPSGTSGWIQEIRWAIADLRGRSGLDLAEARSTRVWAAGAGEDLVRAGDGDVWNVQDRALSVWTKDDEERLALTEADIEAWIRYASLCREVQGGDTLRISVADRVTVYRIIMDRFDTGDRATQVALSGFGPHWNRIRDAWQAAPYEVQQAWMAKAPLPPPMTATSKGYLEGLIAGDLARHVQVLDEELGPFHLGAAPPAAVVERPLELER
jgi:hypothetical protein